MNSNRLLSCVALFFVNTVCFQFSASAQPGSCVLDLMNIRRSMPSRIAIPKTAEEVLALAENEGLTSKGFITGYVTDLSPEMKEVFAKKGIMKWSIRVHVAKNLEDAKRIYELENERYQKDPVFKHLYLIDPNLNLIDSKSKSAVNLAFYNSVLTNRLIYWDYTDSETVHDVPLDDRLWRFNPKNMKFIYSATSNTVFASVEGHVLPKMRGVIFVDSFLAPGKQKNLKYEARRLTSEGSEYEIHFNRDFMGNLKRLADQERVAQALSQSRYRIQEQVKLMIEAYNEGRAYSLEVVLPAEKSKDGKEQIVGGFVGKKSGNLVSIDSVFYTDILFAKIPVAALVDFLKLHGIKFIDMNMLSRYSILVGAEAITRDEYYKLKDELPSEPIDLTRKMIWRPEIKDKKGKVVTPAQFITLADPNKDTP